MMCDVMWRPGGGEVFIAALADGAGSADQARLGALMAVAYFYDAMAASLDEEPGERPYRELVVNAVSAARQALSLYADRKGHNLRSFASTLIACVLDDEGGVIAQIGDGAAVVASAAEPGVWRVPIWPDHGEYVNTTSFLTDVDAEQKIRVATIDEPAAHVSLFTDGLERLVLDFARRQPHAPFFKSVFRELENAQWQLGESQWTSAELSRLLKSDRVARRTDDDRSLVIASLREVRDGG